MKILATSDLHGNLPDVPSCDLLLIGGDVCPVYDHDVEFQYSWLNDDFRCWLEQVDATEIIAIAGNHDFIFEQYPDQVTRLKLPWIYLQDSGTEFEGISIYGLPWVPNLVNWAFHASREQLALRYNAVPRGTDIVLSHGPPFGLGDFTAPRFGSMHVGSKSANDMLGRVNPQIFINGHIHEGFGLYSYRGQHGKLTDVYNVSLVDENYECRFNEDQPYIVEITIDDAKQDPTDSERKICDPGSDVRQSSESAEGSNWSESSMDQSEDPSDDPLHP